MLLRYFRRQRRHKLTKTARTMTWIQVRFYLPEILFSLFAFSALVQLFYYLWFFRRLAWFRPSHKIQTQEHPVSVIICARDEDENIARNLPVYWYRNIRLPMK